MPAHVKRCHGFALRSCLVDLRPPTDADLYYRAMALAERATFAVPKVLPATVSAHDTYRERFNREARRRSNGLPLP
ncbi:hypothetical protein MMON_16530 [Mycolicibacterium monacense]|uniref:Uncharacterized protein n=1 Tax=Mycolicibacterium monacense TaxID=85693 RepID=A0AAD1MYX9_MYCMB|nr:hypothetical protein MMON_16530 [Mycolicibacterium monacense]